MPREVVSGSLFWVRGRDEKIPKQNPACSVRRTSVDAELSGWSAHARRGEEGLQRRLASEPYRRFEISIGCFSYWI